MINDIKMQVIWHMVGHKGKSKTLYVVHLNLILCFTGCQSTQNGQEYAGNISHTKTGILCQVS